MKHSRNQRLSEHLLNVDEEILTNAYNVDDAEKLKAYKKTKHTNIRPIYAARKPIRKAVWVPAVAAAACVALTVGLWQGGVFTPAEIPVETPDNGTTTTAEPTEPSKKTEPSKTTAKPTESTKTTEPSETTAKHTNPTKTEPTKTTEPSKTTKPIIINGKKVVFADDRASFPEALPYDGYLHGTVKEKMEHYKGQDVLYAVVVEVPLLGRDIYEFEHPSNPLPKEKWYSENQMYSQEFTDAYFNRIFDQRVEKLKEIIGKELIPISTDDKYWAFYTDEEYAFFMELTAKEINELDKCDCFFIRLRHPDGDAAAGLLIPE